MYKLTDLPGCVLTRILSFLLPNHQSSTSLNQPFPQVLLASCLASPVLARAAAPLLGAGVTCLTPYNTNNQLHLWARALGQDVRAIIAGDIVAEWALGQGPDAEFRALLCKRIVGLSVELFRVLSTYTRRLEVLDIVRIPFDTPYMQDELIAGLWNVLENNSGTLRELALPVNNKALCFARVLSTVTLPRLNVFAADNRVNDPRTEIGAIRELAEEKRAWSRALLLLQAIHGHADRALGTTTLTEIYVRNVLKAPSWSLPIIVHSTDFMCPIHFV